MRYALPDRLTRSPDVCTQTYVSGLAVRIRRPAAVQRESNSGRYGVSGAGSRIEGRTQSQDPHRICYSAVDVRGRRMIFTNMHRRVCLAFKRSIRYSHDELQRTADVPFGGGERCQGALGFRIMTRSRRSPATTCRRGDRRQGSVDAEALSITRWALLPATGAAVSPQPAALSQPP